MKTRSNSRWASSKRIPRSIICWTREDRSSRIIEASLKAGGRRPQAEERSKNFGPWPSAFGLLELFPCDQPKRLDVLRARSLHDVVRERGDRRLFVPADLLEVVAHELLVEARLPASWRILIARPESRGVGRQHLVDQNQFRAVRQPKLELGVCNDDAARLRMRDAARVD